MPKDKLMHCTTRQLPKPRRAGAAAWWLVALVAALTLGAPWAAVPAMAQAARRAVAAPQITGLDVQPAERLVPGADLSFTAWGTPGGTLTLDIVGVGRKVYLQEVRAGVYEGVYTLSTRDNVAPNAHVTASLRRGNQVSTALLHEPLQMGWQGAPPAAATAPSIQRFTITQGGGRQDRQRVRVLSLRVEGTPGALVTVALPGAQNRQIRLDELTPGVYTAQYTPGDGDALRRDADATATIRLGDLRSALRLPQALTSVQLSPEHWQRSDCSTCGRVVAVNRLQVAGDGAPVGTVAGGLLGAVIGSQFGKGSGRTAAGVAGAVGGAVLGRQIDKRRNLREQYEVVLRMSDGSQRTITQDADPGLANGTEVRVVDGKLLPANG